MTSRHPWRRGLGLVGAVGVAAGALAVIAGKPQPAVDVDEYQAIMAEEAGAPAVLQQRFEEQRWLSLPLLPPGPEISLALPLGGRVVPFDWKRFPKEFVAGLEGRWENSVPVYDLSLAEDPLTHDTLFYNAAGEPILRLPAPVWSDPADLRLTLASLYGVVPGSADSLLLDARLWDPARLQARLTLIRPEDVEYYLYAEAKVRDYAASLQPAFPPPVMMMMGGSSDLYFSAVQRVTNGIRLSVALPAGFTNRVDIFASTNLVEFNWSVLAATLSTTGGSPLVWTDTPFPSTLRFYAAGDADTDSDLDGLSDPREFFVYHTNPTNLDTDADGLVDGNSGVVGTNLYAAGVQSNGFVQGELTLGTSQLLSDSDDDGVSDGAEVAGGTNPLDPNLPPNVRGTVFYSGLQTGTVRVIAVATSGSWSTARQAAIPAPGAYRIANLPPSNYWIRAFVDSNGDGTNDAPEARGEWAEGAVPVTNRVTDIDFSLADPDDDADGLPDWWEILHWSDTDTEDGEGDPDLDGYANWEEYLARTDPEDDTNHPFNVEGTVTYSGPLEGPIVVLASTSAASWAAAGSVSINTTGTFALLHLPVGASYWVKAFRDSDEDGVFDFGEAWGEDATEYVLDEPVTNAAVALVDHDADGDDLADWFESAYGMDPWTGSNAFVCGWWKMNGSGAETNVVDVSGNTNNGWLVGTAATNWGAGVLHGALALTGSNYVQLVDDESLAPSALTLALWINPAVSLTNGAAVLFSKKDPAAATGYSLSVTNGRVEWIVCQAGVRVLTAAAVLTNGGWRHVAATYSQGRQRLYVDAVQVGATNWDIGTTMGDLDQGTTAPRIGASTDSTPARFFPGLVDDVRIYEGEFASNQVWSIYEAGADLDGDTLRPAAEMAAGSSPSLLDTDGDGVPDAVEVADGTLANNPDTDGDGADDGMERSLGSDAKTPNVVCDLAPDQVTIEARHVASVRTKTIGFAAFETNGLPKFYLEQVKKMRQEGEDYNAASWSRNASREATVGIGCGVRLHVDGNRHDYDGSSSYYSYSYFDGEAWGTNYGSGPVEYWGAGSGGQTNFNSSNNEIESSQATNYLWEGVTSQPVADWSDEGGPGTQGYSRQAETTTLDVSWLVDQEYPYLYDEYEFHATNSVEFATPDMVEWATNDLWAGSPFTTTNLPWGWSWSNNYCGVRSTNESADAKSWRSLASNEVDYSICAAQYRIRVSSPQTGTIYRMTACHLFTPEGTTNSDLVAISNYVGYCTNGAADFHLASDGTWLPPPESNGTVRIDWPSVTLTDAAGLRVTASGSFATQSNPHADGRIFIDTTEAWDGGSLATGQFDRQRIVLTAAADLKGLDPESCVIRWAVYDPDDPATNLQADAKGSSGGDNRGAPHEGDASHWFTSATGHSVPAWNNPVPTQPASMGVLLETADAPVVDLGDGRMGASVVLNLSDDGGDNYRVRAHLAVLGEPVAGTTGGLWTMWRKRTLQVHAMRTEDGTGIYFPGDPPDFGMPDIEQLQADLHTAYANADPEKACYLDIVAGIGSTNLPYLAHMHVHDDETHLESWGKYAWTNLHMVSGIMTHVPAQYHVVGAGGSNLWNSAVHTGILNRAVGGRSDTNLPDTVVAVEWASSPSRNISRSMLTGHELGHALTGVGGIAFHDKHTPNTSSTNGQHDAECVFEDLTGWNTEAKQICERHCCIVRDRASREWSVHIVADPNRNALFDSQ